MLCLCVLHCVQLLSQCISLMLDMRELLIRLLARLLCIGALGVECEQLLRMLQ